MAVRWSALAALAAVLAGPPARTSSPGGPPSVQLREIFAPRLAHFTAEHPGSVNSFDISPDGRFLAVEFGTSEPQGGFGEWVAVWAVDAQRLVAEKQVERNYPVDRIGMPFAWYRHEIRFSPDGRLLLVLTGPRLVALAFPYLRQLYTFEDRVMPDDAEGKSFLTDFSVAGGRLAVLRERAEPDLRLYNSGELDLGSFKVSMADLADGKTVAEWTRRGYCRSIALSPDGSLVALTANPVFPGTGVVPPAENNVLLLGADSGRVEGAFNTGYEAADARFVARGAELLTVPADHGANPQNYPRDAAQIWDLRTGRAKEDLSYATFGVRASGPGAVSIGGPWLWVASPWHNPIDIARDREATGRIRLLAWDTLTGHLRFDSKDVSGYALHGGNRGWLARVLVRSSADGSRLAVGGERISVYSIAGER